MPITSLKFTNLGPFEEAEFAFDPQVNVFVGPNNTGKSTALFALAELAVDKFRVPRKLFRVETPTYTIEGHSPPSIKHFRNYASFSRDPAVVGPFTGLSSSDYRMFIPAIRWNADYRGTPITSDSVKADEVDSDGPSLIRDGPVVQRMIDLDYRAYRKNKQSFRNSIERVFACVSAITIGFPIHYLRIDEDKGGLFIAVGTPDGTIPLNNLSQGTQALVQWIGRLILGYAEHYNYPEDCQDKPGILIIDEIDAHLHPSWQRRILPALTKEFPALQVFCSTHSPLMLAGLKAGQVHLLTRDEKGKVVVSRNETDIEGWSADEIMNRFLGVTSTTDVETENRLTRLSELRAKDRLSSAESSELESLRTRIGDALSKSPTSRQVRAVADGLARVVDNAIGAAGNGRKAPTAKPARRKPRPSSTKRPRRKAK